MSAKAADQDTEKLIKDTAMKVFFAEGRFNATTQEIADACQFSLDSLEYIYPEEITGEGRPPLEELTFLTWEGAKKHKKDR